MDFIKRSPWIFHFNAGSCNGCDIEIENLFTPAYDLERFGILRVDSPKHADVLVVTGILNARTFEKLKRIYDQIPFPKRVVVVGSCAISGGLFRLSDNFKGPIENMIPVDVFVPGCPPKPETIIEGILKAVNKI